MQLLSSEHKPTAQNDKKNSQTMPSGCFGSARAKRSWGRKPRRPVKRP